MTDETLSLDDCLKTLGISLLSEWDVLAFLYRHGASLTTAGQIARLVGYDGTVVGDALDRLEREKLIERSRLSEGACFFRVVNSTETDRQRCLEYLVTLSDTRAGRLSLARRLRSVPSESVEMEQSVASGM